MNFCSEHKLFCPSGMQVSLLETGAALTGVLAADRFGSFANVALPLRYPGDPSCAGTTLAPYAGRIARGRLLIDGRTVQLSLNEGPNQIHGGRDSLVHARWRCEEETEGSGFQQIAFSAEAADGQDGFPGSRRFTTTYRLYSNQRLEIILTAETDKPTRVNLSNHAYFNLSGDFSSDVSSHLLQISADEAYLNDEAFLMAGRSEVIPPLDFRQARKIGAPHGHEQLNGAKGLNHCYILNHPEETCAAVLLDPSSGRRMRLYTDHRCLMVYSGGYLDNPNCAIALEAEEHPESPFAPPGKTLYPGETYRRRIVYRFDTVNP